MPRRHAAWKEVRFGVGAFDKNDVAVIVTVELDAPFLLAVSVHLVKVSKVRECMGRKIGKERKRRETQFRSRECPQD